MIRVQDFGELNRRSENLPMDKEKDLYERYSHYEAFHDLVKFTHELLCEFTWSSIIHILLYIVYYTNFL